MKFKPILGSDLSGHVGGVVASHNTYGPYFRQRVRPVNKKTPAMQAQRSAIAAVSQLWRQLPTTVQASWTAATIVHKSRKGDSVALTGHAAFMQLNTLRQRIGVPLLTTAPTDPTPSILTPPAVAFTSASAVTVTFAADTWNAADGGVIVSCALLTSTGVTFKGPQLACATLVNPGTSAVAVTLPFAVPVGGRLRLTFHATGPDGRLSTYVTTDTTNTAFAPPILTPLLVVSVASQLGNQAVWTFNGPVTSAIAGQLLVLGVGGTGYFLGGPDTVVVTYATGPVTGDAWSISSTSATTPPCASPQSGLVL